MVSTAHRPLWQAAAAAHTASSVEGSGSYVALARQDATVPGSMPDNSAAVASLSQSFAAMQATCERLRLCVWKHDAC